LSGRFTIGRLSEAIGTKVQTIRYYEQIGLLPLAPRTEGNQRLYDNTVRRR
jgi:DNA-binding transcriptional MerR regulator